MRQENRTEGETYAQRGVAYRAEVGNSELKIWDTQYCSPSKAFMHFREGVCSTFMPWSPEHKVRPGLRSTNRRPRIREWFGRSRGHDARCCIYEPKQNIAASPLDGIYANYVVSGELLVEQAGRTTVARRGDLVCYHTALPVTLTEKGDRHYEDVAFLFPRNCFPLNDEAAGRFRNIVLSQNRMIAPLSSCLNYLAENMATESKEALECDFRRVCFVAAGGGRVFRAPGK